MISHEELFKICTRKLFRNKLTDYQKGWNEALESLLEEIE